MAIFFTSCCRHQVPEKASPGRVYSETGGDNDFAQTDTGRASEKRRSGKALDFMELQKSDESSNAKRELATLVPSRVDTLDQGESPKPDRRLSSQCDLSRAGNVSELSYWENGTPKANVALGG